MGVLIPSSVKQISAVPGHPFYRDDFAKYAVALDGSPLAYVVTADALNGYAHKLAINGSGGFILENKYGKSRTKVVRVKGLIQIFETKEPA